MGGSMDPMADGASSAEKIQTERAEALEVHSPSATQRIAIGVGSAAIVAALLYTKRQ